MTTTNQASQGAASIDSAEFRRLINNYSHAWASDMENTHAYFLQLTAHINTKLTQAYQQGRIDALQMLAP